MISYLPISMLQYNSVLYIGMSGMPFIVAHRQYSHAFRSYFYVSIISNVVCSVSYLTLFLVVLLLLDEYEQQRFQDWFYSNIFSFHLILKLIMIIFFLLFSLFL
jgi:hypothetical protein